MKKKDWFELINRLMDTNEQREVFKKYVDKCYGKNIPIILNLKHLSVSLKIDHKILARIIHFPHSYYREFTIPKRNGSKRIIDAPYPVLQFIQKWILENVLNNIKVHPSAMGFIKNKSIRNNALIHLNGKCVLKMDIKDFFPSISLNRVISIFLRLGYPPKIAYYFAQFCCKENKLPQGAPTSPNISNIIAKRLDARLNALSKHLNLCYTRYADDLTFSGNYIHHSFILKVEEVLVSEGFNLNINKTKLIIGNGKKIITGISISKNKLTLPRSKKRKLRQDAHYIQSNG